MRRVYPATGTPIWIDLHDPSPEEIESERLDCGLRVPSRAELDEIESSSRLQAYDDTLMVSLPVTPYHAGAEPVPAPIGFVLTQRLLVTVRFDELYTFNKVSESIAKDTAHNTSAQIFALIVEAIVDYSADKLEHIKADTRALSKEVFHRTTSRRSIMRKGQALRASLLKLGDMGEQLSGIRETLLALQRAVPFVGERGRNWIGDDVEARLKTAVGDIQSLNDFETHLTDKVQFLLDATLGFISTEQNDIFKVLTIASVVGIPPTFIASMYGMNFHNMPELSWTYGYQWGLLLIVVSTVIPIAWFKWRGWW